MDETGGDHTQDDFGKHLNLTRNQFSATYSPDKAKKKYIIMKW